MVHSQAGFVPRYVWLTDARVSQEVPHVVKQAPSCARQRGPTAGGPQHCVNPMFSERIGNSRLTSFDADPVGYSWLRAAASDVVQAVCGFRKF
jgi:hypothetical protein